LDLEAGPDTFICRRPSTGIEVRGGASTRIGNPVDERRTKDLSPKRGNGEYALKPVLLDPSEQGRLAASAVLTALVVFNART
jgi:hypothetical protein